MSLRSLIFFGAVFLAVLYWTPSHAQYLYMDSNGNGVHDSGDRMKKNGPTTVDLFIDTSRNRDGTAATCNNADAPGGVESPLELFSYSLAFRAVGGTVSWSELTHVPAGFFFLYTAYSTDTEHHFLYGKELSISALQPGLIYLGQFQVQATSGRPSIEFEPVIRRPDGFEEVTGFGTYCYGLDFDNTYKLGSDFHDSDGLAAHGSPEAVSTARITPNPMNPSGTLSFMTSSPGPVRVQLFSAAGRLVRTLLDVSALAAGVHEIPVRATDDQGRALATGVYYFRIQASGAETRGRVAIVK